MLKKSTESIEALNLQVAENLQSLPQLTYPRAHANARKMAQCCSFKDHNGNWWRCRSPFCLICRQKRAGEEQRGLLYGSQVALNGLLRTPPLVLAQTFTLQDAYPSEIAIHTKTLVGAYKRLWRVKGLPYVLGFARALEITAADTDRGAENVHIHAVVFLPSGARKYLPDDWNHLWADTVGRLARSADVGLVRDLERTLRYLSKDDDDSFFKDGCVALEDPGRYYHRITHGCHRLSTGGCLNLPTSLSKQDKQVGLGNVLSSASIRRNRRKPNRPPYTPIPIEHE